MKTIFLIVAVMALLLLNIVIAANESISVTTMKCLDGAYELVNDSIKCVTCASGFTLENGTCVKKTLKQRLNQFVEDNVSQIAPANPALGKGLLIALTVVFLTSLLAIVRKLL